MKQQCRECNGTGFFPSVGNIAGQGTCAYCAGRGYTTPALGVEAAPPASVAPPRPALPVYGPDGEGRARAPSWDDRRMVAQRQAEIPRGDVAQLVGELRYALAVESVIDEATARSTVAPIAVAALARVVSYVIASYQNTPGYAEHLNAQHAAIGDLSGQIMTAQGATLRAHAAIAALIVDGIAVEGFGDVLEQVNCLAALPDMVARLLEDDDAHMVGTDPVNKDQARDDVADLLNAIYHRAKPAQNPREARAPNRGEMFSNIMPPNFVTGIITPSFDPDGDEDRAA